MEPDWVNLLDKPSPLTVSMASRQLSIEETLRRIPPSHPIERGGTRLVLSFKTRNKKGATNQGSASKRKTASTIEPFQGSDAPGGNSTIQCVLARAEPKKVKHNRRYIYVEKFLVQWGPERCTLDEALD
jgi:hypothetical protein